MKRRHEPFEPPQRRDDVELVRAGRRGVWWQAGDGMRIRVAAAEGEPPVQRERLSVLALLFAAFSAGRSRP